MLYNKTEVKVIKEVSLISTNLSFLLNAFDMSIPDLSKLIGLQTSTLYYILNKGDDVKISTLKKITDLFCVSVHDFINKPITKVPEKTKKLVPSSDFLDNICINLESLISKASLSRTEFSHFSGINLQTITDILNKKRLDSKISTLSSISDFFNITIDVLLADNLSPINKEKEVMNLHVSLPIKNDNYRYIPLIDFSVLQDFLNWQEINTVFKIDQLLLINSNTGHNSKIFGLYAPFFTPYFNKNSILVASTNINNVNKELSLYLSYSDNNNEFFLIKKEGDRFYAYTDQNSVYLYNLSVKIVGCVINIILDSFK